MLSCSLSSVPGDFSRRCRRVLRVMRGKIPQKKNQSAFHLHAKVPFSRVRNSERRRLNDFTTVSILSAMRYHNLEISKGVIFFFCSTNIGNWDLRPVIFQKIKKNFFFFLLIKILGVTKLVWFFLCRKVTSMWFTIFWLQKQFFFSGHFALNFESKNLFCPKIIPKLL